MLRSRISVIIEIFSLFFLFAFSLSSVSCDSKKKYKIGISQCSADDWREKMNEEIYREAMLHDDVVVEIRSADDNSKKQIEDIRYFLDNDFDILVISPNESVTLTPIIKDIHESGFPVMIFDRDISTDDYTQKIGVDNVGIGMAAAEYALSLVPENLKAIEIFGLPGSTPAEERSRGFREALKATGGVILGSAPADWHQEIAEHVADSLLKKYPETNLIFAHNDRMAIGAAEIANRSGREDIKVVGIDAAPNIGIQAVSDGILDATFLYPTEGHLILREALKIIKGEPFERNVMLPLSSAVDSSNADILLLQNETMEEDTKKVKVLKGQLDDYLTRHTAQTYLFFAIIIILILLFGFLFMVLRTFWQHRRHQEALMRKNKLLEEERDKQKELNARLEEMTQSKLAFFTNVSHDLRTPLTLISEPVSQLSTARNLDNKQKALVKIADKNVKILQRLINQILDFRKFEHNKLKLNLTEIDFRNLVREWLEAFYALAKKHDISLILKEPEGENPVKLAIDAEKIERVFFNLISNAIKYSPDNSTITVSYEMDDNFLTLRVEDTGEGIDAAHLSNIFDKFYQVDSMRPKGSGIGLSLAKAFVELHGGTIKVESELNKGSVFTVRIPVVHVSDEISRVENVYTEEDVRSELDEVENPDEDVVYNDEKPLILVIDDNNDILILVNELLKDDYTVILASNGKEGIKKASRFVPDLIICDVMMPGMDGMECCARLKEEQITSHIPVLMLTACNLDEQRVKGFESGADGYLSKPFPSELLKAQVLSLIENRKRIKDITKIQKREESQQLPSRPIRSKGGDVDYDFYNKFLSILEKEIGNSELNVETLAASMGLERTQFYRKIKSITNYSPVELVRNIRLKKARNLLKTTDRSISEIAYEVGFSTPAYFTKCFREKFGETPSEVRE